MICYDILIIFNIYLFLLSFLFVVMSSLSEEGNSENMTSSVNNTQGTPDFNKY